MTGISLHRIRRAHPVRLRTLTWHRHHERPVASRGLRRLLLCIVAIDAVVAGLVYWVMHLIAS